MVFLQNVHGGTICTQRLLGVVVGSAAANTLPRWLWQYMCHELCQWVQPNGAWRLAFGDLVPPLIYIYCINMITF